MKAFDTNALQLDPDFDADLLRAFFERGRFALQIGEGFSGEMQ